MGSAFSGSGGLGCGTMSGIQTSIASTGTSSRQFHIRHRTSNSLEELKGLLGL